MKQPISRLSLVVTAALLPLVLAAQTRTQQQPASGRLTILATDSSLIDRADLSPDARWIVFSRSERSTKSSIWARPTAGGPAVRLTDGSRYDFAPRFYPSGDRVLYSSAGFEPGETDRNFLMTLRFDASSGRAIGSPRRLSAEPASPADISPDGKWVAYRNNAFELRIIPASGGTARTVAENLHATPLITWLNNSNELLYRARTERNEPQKVMRVAVSGGTPREIFRSTKNIRAISPTGDRFALIEQGPPMPSRMLDVVDGRGRIIVSSPTTRTLAPARFSRDGKHLFGMNQDVGATIRVRSVRNGLKRDLTNGQEYDWIEGWRSDGRPVYGRTDRNGTGTLTVSNLDGKPALTVTLPPNTRPNMAVDGRHAAILRLLGGGQRHELIAIDLQDGKRVTLAARGVMDRNTMVGRGGLYGVDHDEFLYAEAVGFDEQGGGNVVLRAVSPGKPSRTLRTISRADHASTSYAVHGARLAWPKVVGDSVAIVVADGPNGAEQILTMIGPKPERDCCRIAHAFSFDGRWLVSYAVGQRPQSDRQLLLIEVPPSGRASNIRTFTVPGDYWYEPRWLPDNSGVTIISGRLADADVVFIPFRAGEQPVTLSHDDKNATWGQVVSFDGKYVAYPAEIWRGSKMWRLSW